MTKAEALTKRCPRCKSLQLVKRPVAEKFRSHIVRYKDLAEACSLCSGRGFLDAHAAELVCNWQAESIG